MNFNPGGVKIDEGVGELKFTNQTNGKKLGGEISLTRNLHAYDVKSVIGFQR